MRGKMDVEASRPEGRPGASDSLRARANGAPTLPSWRSFPTEDRDRLVRLILRAARRQVEAGPTGPAPTR